MRVKIDITNTALNDAAWVIVNNLEDIVENPLDCKTIVKHAIETFLNHKNFEVINDNVITGTRNDL